MLTRQQRYHHKIKKDKPWVYHFWWAKDRCKGRSSNTHLFHKGMSFELTKRQTHLLWLRDKARKLITPSLDRINPRVGYTLFNCRFVENDFNSGYRG